MSLQQAFPSNSILQRQPIISKVLKTRQENDNAVDKKSSLHRDDQENSLSRQNENESFSPSYKKAFYESKYDSANNVQLNIKPDDQSIRLKEDVPQPRDIVLVRDSLHGYGFVAGSEKPIVIRSVTEGGPSDGKLLAGDRILSVNGENVESAPRERVIEIIRLSSSSITMTVCQPHVNNSEIKSAVLTAAKKARLKNKPKGRVRFSENILVSSEPTEACALPYESFSPLLPNIVKIFLENGQTKSFKYDESTTVKDILGWLQEKLQFVSMKHFTLVLTDMPDSISSRRILRREEFLVQVMDELDSYHCRCSLRVSFIPIDIYDLLDDNVTFEYFYKQSCNDVVNGRLSSHMKADIAIKLAAVQLHQELIGSDMNKMSLKTFIDECELSHYLAPSVCEQMGAREIRRQLLQNLKSNKRPRTTPQRDLGPKLLYLRLLAEVPYFGGAMFQATAEELDYVESQDILIAVGPRSGISQIKDLKNCVMKPIMGFKLLQSLKLNRETYSSMLVTVQYSDNDVPKRSHILNLSMSDEDAYSFIALVEGYYRLSTDNDNKIVSRDEEDEAEDEEEIREDPNKKEDKNVHFDKPVTPDFIAEPWFKQKDIIEKAEKKECIPDILLPFNYQVAEDADQSDDIAEAKQVETQNELPVVKPPLRRLYGNKNKSVVDSPNSAGSIQDLMNITYEVERFTANYDENDNEVQNIINEYHDDYFNKERNASFETSMPPPPVIYDLPLDVRRRIDEMVLLDEDITEHLYDLDALIAGEHSVSGKDDCDSDIDSGHATVSPQSLECSLSWNGGEESSWLSQDANVTDVESFIASVMVPPPPPLDDTNETDDYAQVVAECLHGFDDLIGIYSQNDDNDLDDLIVCPPPPASTIVEIPVIPSVDSYLETLERTAQSTGRQTLYGTVRGANKVELDKNFLLTYFTDDKTPPVFTAKKALDNQLPPKKLSAPQSKHGLLVQSDADRHMYSANMLDEKNNSLNVSSSGVQSLALKTVDISAGTEGRVKNVAYQFETLFAPSIGNDEKKIQNEKVEYSSCQDYNNSSTLVAVKIGHETSPKPLGATTSFRTFRANEENKKLDSNDNKKESIHENKEFASYPNHPRAFHGSLSRATATPASAGRNNKKSRSHVSPPQLFGWSSSLKNVWENNQQANDELFEKIEKLTKCTYSNHQLASSEADNDIAFMLETLDAMLANICPTSFSSFSQPCFNIFVKEIKTLVSESKELVNSVMQSQHRLLDSIAKSVQVTAKLILLCRDVVNDLCRREAESKAIEIIGLVKDTVTASRQMFQSAWKAVGCEQNDVRMKELMKDATSLATSLSVLVKAAKEL